MKEEVFTRRVCKDACAFYKPGKKEERCGGYAFLIRHITAGELRGVRVRKLAESDFSGYARLRLPDIEALLCGSCDFRIDGCDFAENCSGPPCGGYLITHRFWTNLESQD